MSYTIQPWADNDPSKPVSAARMLVIENGLAAAAAAADTATTNALNAQDIANQALTAAATATPGIAQLPAGATLTVIKDPTNGWPARPTSRTDIVVAWKGQDPSPPIVGSGTGGMLNNVDYRLVTP